MPEEVEVPTEHLQEAVEHEIHGRHGGTGHAPETRWISMAALTAAILAVLAALSALFAGHDANEAMLDQIRASDGYAFYQAKGIKSAMIQAKMEILAALGKDAGPADRPAIERYKKEQEEIKADADRDAASSNARMARHGVLARSVTLFQIAIAMAAISVLTKKKPVWILSLLLGGVGFAFLAQSLV
jgi:hypothetical protein